MTNTIDFDFDSIDLTGRSRHPQGRHGAPRDRCVQRHQFMQLVLELWLEFVRRHAACRQITPTVR